MVGDRLLGMFWDKRTRDEVMGQVKQVHGFKGGGTGGNALIPGGGYLLVCPLGFSTYFPKSLHAVELAALD